MSLTEKQEEIREQFLQLHKPKEMEIIKKIEQQHKYISTLCLKTNELKNACQQLAQYQQEYYEFDAFIQSEVNKIETN
jgi:phosphoribosylanthranilate isomerase